MVSNLMPGTAPTEPPTRWDETAMKQDFVTIAEKFRDWRAAYKDEIPSPEFEAVISIVEHAVDTLEDAMSGEL